MRPARGAGENIPAAPPTRAPELNDIPFEMRIAAGLRAHGRAANRCADSYCMPLPEPRLASSTQCQ
jgi:hypothetical protein